MKPLLSKMSGPWASALMFAVGVFVGGGMMAEWPAGAPRIETTGAVSATRTECSGGDEISKFVCRNAWMGQHRYSYR